LFTVDVESIPLKNGTKDYSSIIEGIPLLLDLFKEFSVFSTFFLTSDVVENTAYMIREVAKRGHEIGCHGAEHQLLNLDDRDQQFKNIERATEAIRENLHIAPIGFRAPANKVNEKTLDVLMELGYRYDSSVVPSFRILRKYYFPKAPQMPYQPSIYNISEKGQSSIIEIPISVLPRMKLPLVFSYMLLFGLDLFKFFLSSTDQSIMTFVMHTYDLFLLPDQVDASLGAKILYKKGKGKRYTMLRDLLEFLERRFCPTYICAREVLEHKELVSRRELNHPSPPCNGGILTLNDRFDVKSNSVHTLSFLMF
jgi:hypothetical protein